MAAFRHWQSPLRQLARAESRLTLSDWPTTHLQLNDIADSRRGCPDKEGP